VKPSEVIIREGLTSEIKNAICNWYAELNNKITLVANDGYAFAYLEEYIWCYFQNKKKTDFWLSGGRFQIVSTQYIENNTIPWFKRLDLIEETLGYLKNKYPRNSISDDFSNLLNAHFERLNFAYRIVDLKIVEITSAEEIQAIQQSLENNKDNVKMHLSNALKLYAQRPEADYRNSIKESITAVEALSREITGDKGINLSKMESAGIKIPPVLRKSFEILYGYTNDPNTGIRHALMDDTAEYVPRADEALFMLVSCSAFINYLNSKMT
jgi:hypothetical protein